jgi:hypothetical protein
MKTKEQIKTEVINYLNKCTKHLFMIGVNEFKEHKILLHQNWCIYVTGDRIRFIDIDLVIKTYGNNSKSVISDMLFVSYNTIKTIPYYKSARQKWNDVIIKLEGKTDKLEIEKIIKEAIK